MKKKWLIVLLMITQLALAVVITVGMKAKKSVIQNSDSVVSLSKKNSNLHV